MIRYDKTSNSNPLLCTILNDTITLFDPYQYDSIYCTTKYYTVPHHFIPYHTVPLNYQYHDAIRYNSVPQQTIPHTHLVTH